MAPASPLKGILLLATNHAYYGRMAFNLAVTIKAVEPDMPVAIAYRRPALNHLSDKQCGIFDQAIELPDSVPGNYGSKLHLYDLSPFETTLYLDVDMAWLPQRTPSELIAECTTDFTSITEGTSAAPHPKYYFWAQWDEIKSVYGLEKMYQWRSEVIVFKKVPKVEAMFKSAQEIYANPKLTTISKFYGHIPDELCINISCAIHGIEPHMYRWQPSYWPRLHGDGISLDDLYEYYLLSCGSNANSSYTKKAYDRVVKAACYKLKTQHVFPLENKKEFIPERLKL